MQRPWSRRPKIIIFRPVLSLALTLSACKSTGARLQNQNARESKDYTAVVKLQGPSKINPRRESSGSGFIVEGKDGKWMILTNRHVYDTWNAADNTHPTFDVWSNAYHVLLGMTEGDYTVMTVPSYAGMHDSTDLIAILPNDQIKYNNDVGIKPLKFAAVGASVGDLTTVVGYGNDEGGNEINIKRAGTNYVAAIEGLDQEIVHINPKVYTDSTALFQCSSIFCFKTDNPSDGAIGSVKGSGSPILDSHGDVVGIFVAGAEKDGRTTHSLSINIHNTIAGAFIKSAYAKIGGLFNPSGYDSANNPLPIADAATRAGSDDGYKAPPAGDIVDVVSGEVLFRDVNGGGKDAAPSADAAVPVLSTDAPDSSSERPTSSGSSDSRGPTGGSDARGIGGSGK